MSEQSKGVLLIDVGNSVAKYTIIDSEAIVNSALVDIDIRIGVLGKNESPLTLMSNITSVYLSYVREPEWLESFLAHISMQDVTLHIANAEKHARINHSILTNSYSEITTMGCDRWLAMMAAVGLYPDKSDFVIVDAGTAITCDVIFRHVHQGGWIAPGFSSIKASLLKNTEKVFEHEHIVRIDQLNLGNNTADCVEYGCLAQINGIVNEAIKQLSTLSEDFLVIISGGDREKIFKGEKNVAIYKDNLVLIGLIQLAKNHQIR